MLFQLSAELAEQAKSADETTIVPDGEENEVNKHKNTPQIATGKPAAKRQPRHSQQGIALARVVTRNAMTVVEAVLDVLPKPRNTRARKPLTLFFRPSIMLLVKWTLS